MIMDKDSILIFSDHKGFGEVLWITCPACWNSMRTVRWEDGETEEACVCCLEMEGEIIRG
jgi:hypothetical protein